jgi:hypothetical protein
VVDTSGKLIQALQTFLLGLPILSLLLGILVALFPYRQLSYEKKYLRAFLLCLLVMNIIMAICLILIVFMAAAGWYPPPQQ